MPMQRRHFELIANTLAGTRDTIQGEQFKIVHDLYARAFATHLQATNPNFNRDKFLRACGVSDS